MTHEQGTGYVHGEVVPDEETEAPRAEQTAPVTPLRKVASALRGDKPDQTIPEEDEPVEGEYRDATAPHDVGAVRSPEAGDREYWDDEQDTVRTTPDEGATASDPSVTGASTYGTTVLTGTGGATPASGYGSQVGTEAGYRSQAGTEAGYRSQADTEAVPSSYRGATQGYGSQTGTTPGYGAEAGTASGYDRQADTATDLREPTGTGPGLVGDGTAEGGPTGRHAAEDAGLRPGEATDRLGDFGDIAFGNLLPDAAQYSAQWQQIQFRFVDDPQGSVTEAADVISQVTARLETAIQERQRAIEERQRAIQERASALRGRWGEGSNADTETLRETLRMYRSFMDQLIGPAS
jgi:hypothetical protein